MKLTKQKLASIAAREVAKEIQVELRNAGRKLDNAQDLLAQAQEHHAAGDGCTACAHRAALAYAANIDISSALNELDDVKEILEALQKEERA